MILAKEILSDAQSKVNDLAMERIQRGEWLDMLNLLAIDIAQETQVYINRYTAIPNQVVIPWVINSTYTQGNIVPDPNVAGLYWYCLVYHISTTQPDVTNGYWQTITTYTDATAYVRGDLVHSGGTDFWRCTTDHTSNFTYNDPYFLRYWTPLVASASIYHVELPFTLGREELSPFKIIRVIREGDTIWTEAREYSEQAVARKISGNTAFEINNTDIGPGGYSTQFVLNQHANTNSIYLIFAEPFEIGQSVVIDYISNRPWGSPLGTDPDSLRIWNANTPQTIPDFLGDSFRTGLIERACEKLYLAGDESFRPRLEIMGMKHKDSLKKATAYARNFLTTQHHIKIQPMNYLSEV